MKIEGYCIAIFAAYRDIYFWIDQKLGNEDKEVSEAQLRA